MTGVAILLGGAGAMLIWGGITGKNPVKEFMATITGKKKV